MAKPKNVVVVGLGEVGGPILELASKHYQACGVDISLPAQPIKEVDVVHICYPWWIRDFVAETARYIELLRPNITIINSTVAVGTTRAIAKQTGAVVVNSPVRGKHAHMLEDLLHYTKFVGAMEPVAAARAASHFQSLGMRTKILCSPEATELAKLTETTYFGLLIAWAQEVEGYCDQLNQNYREIVSFYEEVKFFPPVKYLPGIIGGHCVMPNIEILSLLGHSEILQAIKLSNGRKIQREICKAKRKPSTANGIAAARLAVGEAARSV